MNVSLHSFETSDDAESFMQVTELTNRAFVVDLTGLEPVTPSLQMRCSTN